MIKEEDPNQARVRVHPFPGLSLGWVQAGPWWWDHGGGTKGHRWTLESKNKDSGLSPLLFREQETRIVDDEMGREPCYDGQEVECERDRRDS